MNDYYSYRLHQDTTRQTGERVRTARPVRSRRRGGRHALAKGLHQLADRIDV